MMTSFQKIQVRIQKFLKRYDKIVTPLVLIGGFIGDIFTLNRIDQTFDNAILIVHLFIVGTMITFLWSEGTRFGEKIRIKRRREMYRAIMLFSIGGLFSGFFIFYAKSGTLLTGAPFILLMFGLMLGAEFLKKFYRRTTLQISLYFVALFCYLIFFVPLLVNRVNTGLFLVSGGVTLIIITIFIRILRHIHYKKYKKYIKNVSLSIASIFIIFNVLYFLNIIPPVPLSLKFSGVYHNVTRTADFVYTGTYEPAPWYYLRKRSHTYHRLPGEPVYVFTSVFAPTRLTTEIHHRWDFFNTERSRWETRSTIPINIQGGRADGFRGYSYKRTLEPGQWRVAVTNKRSQVLGYVRVRIVEVTTKPVLKQEEL